MSVQAVALPPQHVPFSHASPLEQSASPSLVSQISPSAPSTAQISPRQTSGEQQSLFAAQVVLALAQQTPELQENPRAQSAAELQLSPAPPGGWQTPPRQMSPEQHCSGAVHAPDVAIQQTPLLHVPAAQSSSSSQGSPPAPGGRQVPARQTSPLQHWVFPLHAAPEATQQTPELQVPLAQSASSSHTAPPAPGGRQAPPRQTSPLQHWLLAVQAVFCCAQQVAFWQVRPVAQSAASSQVAPSPPAAWQRPPRQTSLPQH
ncbi:MAG: hypothetical protein DCC58_08745 [Chloroflexi bacterium]|nr:MAG: hypothetical protein DCC58_08745 [Chloroflexota bacterium]